MKQILHIGLYALGLFLGIAAFAISAETPPGRQNPFTTVDLQACMDETLGVKFLCNRDWKLKTEQKAILIIISEGPAVTLTIARFNSPVVFLEQLTQKTLQDLGQYAGGFTHEIVPFANQKAIKVQGIAEDFPEIRLLDFYLLHDLSLYSVLFSVNPQEEFEQFGPLFNRIVASFTFLKKPVALQP